MIAQVHQGRNTRIVVGMLPLSCHWEEEPRVRRDSFKKLKFKLDIKG